MVVRHLELHGNDWPRDWNDLSASYEIEVKEARSQPFEFDEIRSRCDVRFDVRSEDVLNHWKTTGKSLQVVTIHGGQDHYWSRHEPNQEILDYLIESVGNNTELDNARGKSR